MRGRAAVGAIVVASLLGCGGDDGGETAQTTAVTADRDAEPQRRSTAEERTQQRFDLPGGPDWLAVGDDAVWVKRDDGHVDRVDPATNEVVSVLVQPGDEPGQHCQGLGVAGDEVWACSGTSIARIAPDASRVIATVDVGKAFEQGHIGVGFGHVWVLTGDGSTLVGVSSATNEPANEIALGARCTDLALSEDAIWIACSPDDVVLRVDPEAGEVTGRVDGLEKPARVAVAGDVWVAHRGNVARVDPDTATVTGLAPTSPDAVDGLFATDDLVWLRSAGRFLRSIDAETMALVEDMAAPEESGGDVVVAFGSIWATAYDDAVLYRLRLP